MKLPVLLFAGWSTIAACSAHAAFFTDEEAHNQIRQLKERVSNLEGSGRQQTETIKQQAETIKQQIETRKQQTREVLDLQAQIETQKTELRRLRGQNEELVHGLQDAEKRQRDSYIDLDTRVRRFEKLEAAVPPRPIKP
ncbi:YbgF trimerization domain-containing protein [Candidatus Nitrotoga sp. 1052]|uniref:YbgF trimerization domain-containing protein n=1 Tax=Candidatus Nitrotoga sp. 1052 TaxID=2886964 RepID=UPI001EF64793|nr:YbgF trimerization domain-containing protein [Candidatus Nitrotoga sp. 1052]CAH1081806.1 TolA binding protein trimerization [Candidatus Nitrotoga sp. 1052]